MRKTEFVLSIVCFLGVAFLGVIEGIFIAVVLALMNFIWRAWRPYDAMLGKVDGLKGYHDVTRYPAARRVPDTSAADVLQSLHDDLDAAGGGAALRRGQGPGQGPAQALRAAGGDRTRALPSDRWVRRGRLRGRDQRRLA